MRGDEAWRSLEKKPVMFFCVDSESTYVRRAPYFDGMTKEPEAPKAIENARVLLNVGRFYYDRSHFSWDLSRVILRSSLS